MLASWAVTCRTPATGKADTMRGATAGSTKGQTPLHIGCGLPFDTFAIVHHAIRHREEVWGYMKGQGIRFCPHALGWRRDDAYVLGLILRERHEGVPDGASWEWLMEWQWLRLADLEVPLARKGEWVTCPGDQRPSVAKFLTEVYAESE